MFTIRIQTHNKHVIGMVKRQFNQFLRMLRARRLSYLATYLRHKTRFQRIKGPKLADSLKDNISAAQVFHHDLTQTVTAADRREFDNWNDVVRMRLNWDVPMEHPSKQLAAR